MIIWATSSVLLTLALMVMRGLGFGDWAHAWNKASLDGLSSWHLFEWFKCYRGIRLKSDIFGGSLSHAHCQINPIARVLESGSTVEVLIKLLELATGIIVVLFWIGDGSLKKGIEKIPPPYVAWYLIGSVVGLWSEEITGWFKHVPSFVSDSLAVVFMIVGFAMLPAAFVIGIVALFTLAVTTAVSLPILGAIWFVSEVLGEVISDAPAFPITVGGFGTMICACTGKTAEAGVHEFLNHTIVKAAKFLRPGS